MVLVSAVLQGENSSTSRERVLGKRGGKRYTLFQGHSGPVYSATFSPLGGFFAFLFSRLNKYVLLDYHITASNFLSLSRSVV
jgi:hypothetical protein